MPFVCHINTIGIRLESDSAPSSETATLVKNLVAPHGQLVQNPTRYVLQQAYNVLARPDLLDALQLAHDVLESIRVLMYRERPIASDPLE